MYYSLQTKRRLKHLNDSILIIYVHFLVDSSIYIIVLATVNSAILPEHGGHFVYSWWAGLFEGCMVMITLLDSRKDVHFL